MARMWALELEKAVGLQLQHIGGILEQNKDPMTSKRQKLPNFYIIQ